MDLLKIERYLWVRMKFDSDICKKALARRLTFKSNESIYHTTDHPQF